MTPSKTARIAASTFVMGMGLMAAGPIGYGSAATASGTAAEAGKYAAKATKLLASAKADKANAVRWAETAVARSPNDANLRFLLGRAYLANGRLRGAETSFADALALNPSNGRAALNLALMKAARGAYQDAISLIEENRDQLDAADYGLALALSGDVSGGVAALEASARAPGAGARVRQNLALSYALANRWSEARRVASQDLAPELVNDRLASWAQMAHPRAAWDQVAGVLGIQPVADAGQPAQLALNVSPVAAPEALAAAPHAAPVEPVRVAEASVEAAPVVVAAAAPVAPAAPAPVFDVPREIAQPLPAKPVASAPLIKAVSAPVKQAVVPAKRPTAMAEPASRPVVRAVESGKFVVQLGAYDNASVAQTAWNRHTGKLAELAGYQPVSARVKVKAGSFYRLSVSGFTTRKAAGLVCARVKAAGGQCFVRSVAGDTPIQWARRGNGGTMIASRR